MVLSSDSSTILLNFIRRFLPIHLQMASEYMEHIQLANKDMKIYLKLLAIGEMRIKTRRKYLFTPTRMAIRGADNNKCWLGCGDIGALIKC